MIFYIAICDLLALLNAPLFVCTLFGIWATGFPNIHCKLMHVNSYSVSVASFLLCAFTALERVQKVILSKEIISLKLAKYIWIPIFLLSFGIGFIVFRAMQNNENGHCMYNKNFRYLLTIEYALIMFIASVSSIVMTLCYTCIGFFLNRKMKEITKAGKKDSFMKSYRNTIQTTKMLAIVTIVFVISALTPYLKSVFISLDFAQRDPVRGIIFLLSRAFLINSFFNPLLYMGTSAIFRQRSLAVVRSCCGNPPSWRPWGIVWYSPESRHTR